jgi:hypothetical protein
MPINSCSSNGSPGFKWGDDGKCYTYASGDNEAMKEARKKAQAQGVAARMSGYLEKENTVTTSSMGSGIKNPQQGYSKPKKKKAKIIDIEKSLTEWFREDWVDISRPKAGGGFEPCGRSDASSGKYPKCVPASRAAKMTPEQIRSAVQRKRRAESTTPRKDKKPTNVPTEIKKASRNVPTNPALYARVKAAAKAKFDVYPSAYANAWLVREYKKRGGGYRTVSKSFISKIAEDLEVQEALLADMLEFIADQYGKFDEDDTGIWAGYESASENEDASIGVKCENCVLYDGDGVCKIIKQTVEPQGKCRFAIIPDDLVTSDEDSEVEENGSEGGMMKFISIPVDNAEKMVDQHKFLLKEALKAAAYHQDQIDTLSKAVKDVTFMLTETTRSLGGTDGGDTGEPASATPSASDETTKGPGKVETVRKSDLIATLKAHQDIYGDFDVDVDIIADFLIGE